MVPGPGTRLVRWVGDSLTIQLSGVPDGWTGKLRTQIGRAGAQRAEIIAASRQKREEGLAAWQDLPMHRRSDGVWEIEVPLAEVGFFPAKAYALDSRGWQHWPGGVDFGVNVLPAWTRSGNTLYCVFPRQFGPNKTRRITIDPEREALLGSLIAEGYATLPPSGKLRDVTRSLDHICGTLGFRDLLLLPVNPTPTTFARFGRFGSPYAAQDLTAIDPALVEFDQRTTGVQQFEELTHAVHCRGGRVFLDMVINHTGWGSTLWEKHPEWFHRQADGRFLSPGAWGTVWEDLVELDPNHRELWHELAKSFVTWCRRGVDGFRCDAGYKVPVPVWRYISALVRLEFPDTVFFLEGLGGAWEATEALLTVGGMQWAYSELFQNYDANAIRWYLDAAGVISRRSGPLVHFSETHDNTRLPCQPQAWAGTAPEPDTDRVSERGRRWSLLRNRLCALTSVAGGYAITNGVEWLATERVNVHSARGLAWGSADHLIPELAALNRLLRGHPAFRGDAVLTRVSGDASPVYALRRVPAGGADSLLILINPDLDQSQVLELSPELWRELGEPCVDLLAESPGISRVSIRSGENGRRTLELPGGAVWCLSVAPWQPAQAPAPKPAEPAWLSPVYRPEVEWTVTDATRVLIWPADHVLVVRDRRPFRLEIAHAGRVRYHESPPEGTAPGELREVRLSWPEAELGECRLTLVPLVEGAARITGGLHRASGGAPAISTHGRGPVLLTNGRGAMARIHRNLMWIASKYDAVLAVNLDPEVPCDRHVLVKRLRVWVTADGFETALLEPVMVQLEADAATWHWRVPAGGERSLAIGARMGFVPDLNRLEITFWREHPAAEHGGPTELPAKAPVRLSVRLDLEDRGYHSETQRNADSERHFTSHTRPLDKGFEFTPTYDRRLRVVASTGWFHWGEEWSQGIWHPVEASRGMTPHGDAWSPGWFEIPLAAGEGVKVVLDAEVTTVPATTAGVRKAANPSPEASPGADPLTDILVRAARQFVVRRGQGKTVIAGYPWFLDWGRDTLIACRGLLAAGMIDEVRDILLTFARFEEQGTLPNAIYGNNASNRDTSDAPLWFGVACEELAARVGAGVYRLRVGDAGNRTLAEVLRAIASGYLAGAPNGIRVDHASGLVWSPPHFTWMDTNHPAATPREGYPVEIQALWLRLLRQLSKLKMEPWDGRGEAWGDLARRAEKSFLQYFWLEEPGWFADVLLAGPEIGARMAPPSDALRSNTLLPVALGLVTGERARRIVDAARRWLVVPGALRSLAPLPVNPPLPVFAHGGGLLNDPAHPYWPRYEGDEDTRRKPAYHNGTAWGWTFPHFCEALVAAYPDDPAALSAARAYLASVDHLLAQGCLGQLPEIVDGDAPHALRGCDAQAWSVTEALRVWRQLHG